VSNIAISVRNLVKEYEVYTKPIDLALEVLTRRTRHTIFRALDDVSFDVPRGEVLGIIGSNGAGKSTLLKVITGVLEPTSGSVDITGRVTAILELGLGFNAEYSGRENIYLSGLLYGMNRAEINSKLEEIIEFSGLAEFIERPVKTYSSGMHARLAFSIATAVEPDILIIDEALAAGDAAFVQKCLRRIRLLCSGGRTVLLVSHGTGLLAQLCSRVVWMERGQIRMVGSAIQVVQAYDLATHQGADANSWIETVEDPLVEEAATVEQVADEAEGSAAEAQSSVDAVPTLPDATAQPDDAAHPNGALAVDANKDAPTIIDVVVAEAGTVLLAPEATAPPAAPDVESVAVPAAAHDIHDAFVGSGSEAGRQVFRRGPVFIDKVELINSKGNKTARLMLMEPYSIKVHYHVDGPCEGITLGVALAINNKYDLTPVAQLMTQNIRPFETRESYSSAPDRFFAKPKGVLHIKFPNMMFRRGDYLLSIGLLPNEPATWEFYEYRHFYYPFTVDDSGMDVGAPILLQARLVHRAVTDETEDAGLLSAQVEDPDPAANALNQATTLREEIEAVCFANGDYPKNWPRHRLCPACGWGQLSPAFSKYGFTHERCGACDFICVNPYPPDEIMDKLYSGEYYSKCRTLFERPLLEGSGAGTPYSAPEDLLTSIIERTTEGIEHGKWLDVGGGIGAFASLVQNLRPGWDVSLNEFNQQSINIASELFNFNIVADNARDLAKSNAQFDVVSSVMVLEHIPLPVSFLESYAELVKPGGWMVMVVPHFSLLNGYVARSSSPNSVPPYHVSLFTEGALRAAFERVPNLELVAIEQDGPSAFQLIQHVPFGDYWDVTIPTEADPVPRSSQVKQYTEEEGLVIAALSEADQKVGDYFARTDGKLNLIVYCRKRS
jgi:ABC-type polysaccharide/polyol phosphate transport system ATPase subunit/SAM-dependent methyltransferase